MWTKWAQTSAFKSFPFRTSKKVTSATQVNNSRSEVRTCTKLFVATSVATAMWKEIGSSSGIHLRTCKDEKRWKKTSRFFLLALPFLWEHHSLARPPLPRIAWNFLELKTSQRCSKYRLPHPVGLLWKPKNSLPWTFLGCLLSVGSSMWAATEWPNPCPTWSLMCAVFCIASIVWFYIQRYLWTFPVKRFSDAA